LQGGAAQSYGSN
jgi:HK97 family phage major capsid protein